MPAVIRTGVLHNPQLDMMAGEAVRRGLDVVSSGTRRFVVVNESYVGNDRNWIEDVLCRWCDEDELDLVITVGGTLPAAGPSRRELMPEATLGVVERRLPGLPEAMRAYAQEITELALLDRGVAGIRSRTLIVNLPGGEGPAYLFLEAIAPLLGVVVAHLQEEPGAPQLADALELETEDSEPVANGESMVEVAEASMGEPVEPQADEPLSTSKLDAEEFARFLRRKRQ